MGLQAVLPNPSTHPPPHSLPPNPETHLDWFVGRPRRVKKLLQATAWLQGLCQGRQAARAAEQGGGGHAGKEGGGSHWSGDDTSFFVWVVGWVS